MITILQRYIARSTIMATGLAALIIAGVLFLLAFLAELKNIGVGDYHFSQALLYVFMRMPMQLYQFTPLLILLGSIAGLSILSSHRELSVMRASGFSTKQIMLSVFGAALVITLAISLVGESFAPSLGYSAEIRKENAKNAGEAVVTAAGIWLHVDNNFIHINHVIDNKLLEGVTRYEFDSDHRLLATYYAERITRQDHLWIASEVVKTNFYPNRTKSEVLTKSDWNLKLNPNLLSVGIRDPNDMSLLRLVRFSRYLDQNGLQATEYKFEFWQHMLQPVASLIMIFLAIPFVLMTMGTLSLGLRMLIGVMIGFVFFILNALLGQLCIVYQIPALLAATIPLMIFGVVGVLLFRRFNR